MVSRIYFIRLYFQRPPLLNDIFLFRMGLQSDIEWAVSTLSTATRENGYDVCQTVLKRLKCHVTVAQPIQKTGGKLKKFFQIAPRYRTAFEDEETDLCLYADQLEKVIEGLLDGPIHTPVKKRRTHEETIEIDRLVRFRNSLLPF